MKAVMGYWKQSLGVTVVDIRERLEVGGPINKPL